MQYSRQFVTFILLLTLSLGLVMVAPNSHVRYDADSEYNDRNEIMDEQRNVMDSPSGYFTPSDISTGLLDPVVVEQTGYYDTGNLSGRTDTGAGAYTDVPIDNESNWVASEAELNLWNLNREYAENGTYDEGLSGNTTYPAEPAAYPYGWDLDQYDSSGGLQTLITYYDNTSDYVTVENQGEEDTTPSLTYWHYHSTWNLWNQTITNEPYSDNMTLSFSYNYVNGIVNNLYAVGGDVLLTAWIENSTYSDGHVLVDLMYGTPSRDTWYDVVYYNITDAPAVFTLSIGLFILADDLDSFELNPGGDYDNDGAIDGDHTRLFKVHLDDVSLVSVDQPTPEQVDLQFNAGAFSTSITGTSGQGTAVIQNQYWDTSSISAGMSANVSVSFDYDVHLNSHYFSNSSYTPHPTKKGVSYSVDFGTSADLSMFTYIGSDLTSTYENFSVYIYLPEDWENTTIYDPFTNDVTGSCILQAGQTEIPTSLLNRLGWWEIDYQSPNYAKRIDSQVYDSTWSDETLFKSGNITRVQLEIGTATETPSITDWVNVTWNLPDDTVWSQDSMSSGILGVVNSSQRTLAGANTTAGQWSVEFMWTNGTEIAYGTTTFDMYHTATISAQFSPIDIDTGSSVTNWIFLRDADTNDFLMDESVSIVANWSSSTIVFSDNPSKNRWEGTFDTSIVGEGEFLVVVNASRPYFNNVSCTFVVISTFTTQISFPDISGAPIESGLNEIYVLNIQYELTNGTGIAGATISFSYSGAASGLLNGSYNDLGNGNYSLQITGVISGDYVVTIDASKAYYATQSDDFVLTIGETGTFFETLNGTADLVGFGYDYRLVLNYTNSTGDGLIGATIQVTDVTPGTGLTIGSTNPDGGGFYSITFTPTIAGTYTIVLKANITNHVTQYLTFTLLVTDVSTTLTPHTSSSTILIDQSFTLQLRFEDELSNGIDSATISLIDAPSGIAHLVSPLGGGLYNVTLTPSVTIPTSFQLSFKASLTNYQNASTTFSLLVQNIPTQLLVIIGDSSGTIDITQNYNVTISYLRLDTVANISAADLVISTNPVIGITPWWQPFGDVYQLGFTADRIGVWQISVSANRTKFVTATMILELEVLALDTIFTSLNGTVDEVGYGLSYNLILNYTSILGTGLSGSWVNVTEVNPAVGLTIGSTSDNGGGIYSILLTPTIADAYVLTIRANVTNHVTRYLTFSLLVVDTPTVLIPDSSGTTISVDQNYTLQLTYQDTLSNPIDGANITLVDLPSDLAYVWVSIGGGVYNVTLTPSVTESKSFQLSFRASRVNYQTSSTAFTLFVQIIPTTLEVINGSQTETLSIIDSYVVTLAYLRTDTGENVTSADFEITTTPSTGFVANIVPIGDAYQLTFQANSVGIWQLVVTANRTYFVSAIIQLELEILPIDTFITSLNGTADLVEYGDSYRIAFQYTNSSGLPISGANLSITEVTPNTGLSYGSYSSEGNGIYTINLTPSESTTFSIVFRLNITNHVTQYFSFSLVVTPIQTVLIAGESGATISLDQEYIVQVEYKDGLDNPILGATITVPNLPIYLSYSFSEAGGGFYNVTLTPAVFTTTSFQFSFEASLTNYQNSTTAFSLLVQVIPTDLVILEGEAEEIILFGSEYQLTVAYVRTDTQENVTLADFDVYLTPSEGVIPTIAAVGDVYLFTFHVDSVGFWEITIIANKTNYLAKRLTLELEVRPIDTSLNDIALVEALVFGRTYNFTFNYLRADSGQVVGALILISGSAADWASVVEEDDGHYTLSLTPEGVGSFEVSLSFSLAGFVSRTTNLEFDVEEVVMSIVDVQGLSALEGDLATLSLRLVDIESGAAVSGATITYRLIDEFD
ncbi:MAG: hypothetical protein ACXAEF_10435, partial [Candidatus Thorarchaeota archaeon]